MTKFPTFSQINLSEPALPLLYRQRGWSIMTNIYAPKYNLPLFYPIAPRHRQPTMTKSLARNAYWKKELRWEPRL
jgi:hypothetical protein